MPEEVPFRITAEGLLIYLRVTPRAARDAVAGAEPCADGLVRLKVRVRAVPDKGAANMAVLMLLARALGRPKSSLTLQAGASDRSKTVLAVGDGFVLADRLTALLEE